MQLARGKQAFSNGTGISVGIAYLLTFYLSNAGINPIDEFVWRVFSHDKPYPDAATFFSSTLVSYVVSLFVLSSVIAGLLRRVPPIAAYIVAGKTARAFQFCGSAVPILLPMCYLGLLWDHQDLERAFGLLIYVRHTWAGVGAVFVGIGLLLAVCNSAFDVSVVVRPRVRFAGEVLPPK